VKKILAALLVLMVLKTEAQTTAMDFTMNDCNGNMHNLFSELDQNKVVILEFFMLNCTPCISAGHQIDPIYNQCALQYPGHVMFYQFGYDDSYTCTQISNWVNTNGFISTPFDSGANQVAYYGGFGMPTIAVVAGPNHDVIYSSVGYTSGDTAAIHAAIITYFFVNPINSIQTISNTTTNIFPLPANDLLQIKSSEKFDEVNLYSIDRSVLKTYEISSDQFSIDVSDLRNGIYLLRLKNQAGYSYKKFEVLH